MTDILKYFADIVASADYNSFLGKYDPVTAYARMVIETDYAKLCGKKEILACKRHIRDMERAEENDFPFVFDKTRAERIIRHFSNIPRLDADNQTIEFEPWQIFD